MARAFRREWTPDEDSRLREIHAQGHTYRATADALTERGIEVSHQQVAHRCRQLGLLPNNVVAQTANDARRERLVAHREQLAEELLADAVNLRARIWEAYEVIVPGVGIEEQELPDAKAVASFTSAINDLIGATERIERLGGNRTADAAKSMIAKLQAGIEAMQFEDGE